MQLRIGILILAGIALALVSALADPNNNEVSDS